MKKNEIIFVVFLILAVEGFLVWKKTQKGPEAPENEASLVVKKTPENAGVEVTTTTTVPQRYVLNPSYDSQLNESPQEEFGKGFRKVQNPFCRTESEGTILLPSVFLKEFYAQKESWVALPQSIATCFQEKKLAQFLFSEYQGSHQMPWEPLVRMEGRITSVKTYGALSALEKDVDSKKYSVKATNRGSGIFGILRSTFPDRVSEPWQLIHISGQGIEPQPSYWPGPPTFHAVARFISGSDYKTLLQKSASTTVIVDARSQDDKDAYKISSPTIPFRANHSGSHRVLVEPSNFNLAKNKQLLTIDPSKNIVVIGRDAQDVNSYNAANFLALVGYQKISILKGGVQDLGAPMFSREQLTGPFVLAEELKKLKSQNKNLVLIDCRNPGTAKSTIQGALRIAFTETEEGDDIDVTQVNKDLQLRRPSEIVLFGSNGLDPKPNRVKAQLNASGVKVSMLKDGFSAWQFLAKYKWSDVEKPKAVHMGAHPSQRKKGPTAARNPIKIDPKQTLGAPAGSVPAKRIEKADLEKIKARGAKIR